MKVILREQIFLSFSTINFINGMVAKDVAINNVAKMADATDMLKFKDSQDVEKTILISEVKTVQIGFLTCNVRVSFYRSLFVESIEGSGNECLKFMGDWKTNFKGLEGEYWEMREFCAEI